MFFPANDDGGGENDGPVNITPFSKTEEDKNQTPHS